MSNRILTAAKIHDGKGFLPPGSAIELDGHCRIVAIHEKPLTESTTFFSGILCPGFVNAHCHLELSHMQGVIAERAGLIPFLQAVTRQRAGFSDEQKEIARREAYSELLRNGVVAIGDIANTTDSLDLRAKGGMHFHTFVECIGFSEIGAEGRLAYATDVHRRFSEQVVPHDNLMRQSVVPHAPYSVSPKLFSLINNAEPGSLLSIHNGESMAEDEYYMQKSGAVRDLLAGFGIDDSFFVPSGKSSLKTYLPWLSEDHPVVLVHNTYTSAADIRFAQGRSIPPFWCLCPGANIYIEGRLPDVDMLHAHTGNICIGTDSLASNHHLSIVAELQLLKAHFPQLEWEELLRWATSNGARALQMDNTVGSFTPGLAPGVVQLSSLEADATVTRIM